MRIIENSSDLSSGRRPVSKSDEFSVRTRSVIEIWDREIGTFPKKVYTYSDFESAVQLRAVRFSVG